MGRPRHYPKCDPDHKYCPKCDTIKPRTEFYRNKRTGDGLRSYCKPCGNQWSKDNRETWLRIQRRASVKSTYGLTWDQFLAKVEAQDHRCAVCRAPIQYGVDLHIDHDHTCCPGSKSCGKCVRGFLCKRCNFMLGNARDNAAVLRAAADYLEVSKLALTSAL